MTPRRHQKISSRKHESACIISVIQLVVIFKLNPSTGQPLYLQLVQQVRYAIETGVLRDGDTLPGIRTLAEELVVSPNTIAKAPKPQIIGKIAGDRVPWVDEPECVGCNLCQLVCPVDGCITMAELPETKPETWNDRVAAGRDKIPGGIHS